ncbi:MAG: guanine deaminase [Candidatus Kapabacteria bacterium]|jgi:guanine deaminase|nr:guanine deaminase [Candidatus Kapabacteria bacterium]
MRLYSGFIVNPLENTGGNVCVLEYIPEGAIVVGDYGQIEFVGTRIDALHEFEGVPEEAFGDAMILPGLVDTHVHLPQYEAAAIGTGELLDWLNTYIFPLEARFADEEYAHLRSQRFFYDAVRLGTTTMSVYCSSHRRATDIAFEAAFHAGLRVCMGKTMMDFGAPENILHSSEKNIADSLALAKAWSGAGSGRLLYTLTPRFAGSCSRELLKQTGEVARTEGFRIQTHLSENPAELRYIAELFPEHASYTDVYHAYGILTDKTIMAHSIYLSPQEKMLLKAHHCSIAHCPCSNRFLQSGVMALRQMLTEGFRIGLGTDVAGGPSLSVLNEAKEAAESSKTWNILHRGEEMPAISAEESLWLATLGGAQALGLDDIVGNFRVGKEADFIVCQPDEALPQHSSFQEPAQRLARLVYGASPNVVQKTVVQGKVVYAG